MWRVVINILDTPNATGVFLGWQIYWKGMVLPRCSGIGAADSYGSAGNATNLVEMMGLNLEAATERLPTRGFLADLALLLMNHQKTFWSLPKVSVLQSIG